MKIKFRRMFSKSRGKKNKFRGTQSEKSPTKSHEQRVVLSKMTCCFARKRGFLTKTSETCDSQTLWESHHSQQLFLSSKSRVKWSDGNCEYVFRLCSFFWGGLRGLLRITRKWKMTGSCLLHNALHYNGLMTDWGFRTTPLSLADYIMRTASGTFGG